MTASVTASLGSARLPTIQTQADLCARVLSQIQHISVRQVLLPANASQDHANSLVEYARNALPFPDNVNPIATTPLPQKLPAQNSVAPPASLFRRPVQLHKASFSQVLRSLHVKSDALLRRKLCVLCRLQPSSVPKPRAPRPCTIAPP